MNLNSIRNLNIRMCHNFASTSKQIMRTTILIVLFILGVTTTNAQLERGKYLFGLSGSYATNYKTSYSYIELSPKAGYFLVNRLALGTSLYFYHHDYGSSVLKSTGYGVGPFARYYLLPSAKFNLFVQPTFLYSKTIELHPGTGIYSGKRSYYQSRYSVALAPVYFINQYIALEAIAEFEKKPKDPENIYSRFTIRLGIQVHL